MPTREEITRGLKREAEARESAAKAHAAHTDNLRGWLRKAQACPDMAMEEAAKLAGFKSRNGAYQLLKNGSQ